VIPEMVTTTSETVDDEILDDFHLLDSDRRVPMLVQAVKKLKAENDVLKALVCQDQPKRPCAPIENQSELAYNENLLDIFRLSN
ncbi:MAG: hypothetical protein GY866_10255, partial [Proteobacteria bacterium]|nr:hypothetical protein [Pseudomonadota bacterium]